MISTRPRLCDAGRGRNCVVDGDTFRLGGERIRIVDIDAPEISNAECQAERRAGLLARDRLLQLLDAGPFRLVMGERDRDRYGRLLRRVERSRRSLGLVLVEEGLASRWGEPGIAWCKGERR